MFSSRQRLKKRTKANDLNRFDYLQKLVSEYQEKDANRTKHNESDRMQVLANLANFSYDPINFQYLRQLRVIELFIDCIDEDEDLSGETVQFGIGGLCNLAADAINRHCIMQNQSVIASINRCLLSTTEQTVLSALTTLILLATPNYIQQINSPPCVSTARTLVTSSNARVRNLACLLLKDYCNDDVSANIHTSQ